MRNFRKAALAGATAVAVVFGSTAVATAETKKPEATPTPTYTSYPAPVRDQKPGVDNDAEKTNGSSTKLGNKLGVWSKDENGDVKVNGVDGRAIFGTKKQENGFNNQPKYAQAAYGLTVFTAVSAVIGLIVGPLYNFIVHGPVKF